MPIVIKIIVCILAIIGLLFVIALIGVGIESSKEKAESQKRLREEEKLKIIEFETNLRHITNRYQSALSEIEKLNGQYSAALNKITDINKEEHNEKDTNTI